MIIFKLARIKLKNNSNIKVTITHKNYDNDDDNDNNDDNSNNNNVNNNKLENAQFYLVLVQSHLKVLKKQILFFFAITLKTCILLNRFVSK